MSDKQRITELAETVSKFGRGYSAEDVSGLILAENIVIPRRDLPAVTLSDRPENGYYTAIAQQRYQPCLVLAVEDGDKTDGSWNLNIAYANLAVADAIEAAQSAESVAAEKLQQRRDGMAREMHNTAYGPMTKPPVYSNSSRTLQIAIDRIIEFEDRT